jgi:putative ABC transport system permease protein
VRRWWRRRDPDAEIDDEFSTHLALETERHMERGLPADEAHNTAMRRFGNVLRYREETRAIRGLVWSEQLRHDLRAGVRAIARRPAASLAAMIALGVGMGGPAAVIAVLLSISTAVYPGVRQPDRLVMIWETAPRTPGTRQEPTRETVQVWRGQTSFVRQLAITRSATALSFATGGALPENAMVQPITIDLLPLLGVAPASGRAFAAGDDAAATAPVALVSYGFWQSRLGSRDGAVGSTIMLDGAATTIVGVMPRGFWFDSRDVDLWVPLPASDHQPNARYRIVARMHEGDDKAGLAARLAALAPQVAAAQPAREPGWGVRLDGIGPGDLFSGQVPPGVLMIVAAAALGLLAACANIAVVRVARGAARHKETAVRSALGAGRGRLMRQFLAESVVVSAGGGAIALLMAFAGLQLIVTRAPADLAYAFDVGMDWRLVAGLVLVAIAVGVLSGLGPAITDSRVNLIPALKETGYFGGPPARARLRHILIVTEMAVTVMLLASVGLLVRGVMDLEGTSPGFDPHNVLVLRLDPVQHIARAATPPPAVDVLTDRIRVVNGVQSVATTRATLPNMAQQQFIALTGSTTREEAITRAPVNAVSAAYFTTLGIRMVEGRGFTNADRPTSPVVVVSEAFARRHFPGRALGQTLRVGEEAAAREVIGVVSDVLTGPVRREPIVCIYVPYTAAMPTQNETSSLLLLVRTTPGATVIPDLRRTIAEINPAQTISAVGRIADVLIVGAQETRVGIYLTGPILVLAVLLMISGMYGLLAQSVAQRTHELAVRVALGAGRADLLRFVISQGVRLAAIGAFTGSVGALVLDRALGRFLFGVPAEQPIALAGAALVVVAVTLAASIAPCRRALGIDPGKTLRYE